MSRLCFTLIVLAFVVLDARVAFSGPSGLVRVRSEYLDKKTKKWVETEGTGNIIQLPGYTPEGGDLFVVLTAAHVSQGRNLRVFTKDCAPIRVHEEQRLADIENDIEIIPISGQIGSPFGLYEKRLKQISVFWSQLPPARKDGLLGARRSGPDDVSVSFLDMQYVLVPPWLKAEPLPFERDKKLFVSPIFFPQQKLWEIRPTAAGNELMAMAQMMPGMSGSLLLRPQMLPDGVATAVSGVLTKVHRVFRKSYFARVEDVIRLLDEYASQRGRKQKLAGGEWQMESGITYRVFADGTQELISEIQSETSPAGLYGQVGGRRGFGDGGGRRGFGDGGGRGNSCEDASGGGQFFGLLSHDIPDGMQVSGGKEPVIGFQLSDPKGHSLRIPITLFANRAAQALYSTLKAGFPSLVMKPIPLKKSNFIELLRARATVAAEALSGRPLTQPLSGIDLIAGEQRLGGLLHSVKVQDNQINIELHPTAQETLTIVLNADGTRPRQETVFTGVYEVSSGQRRYFVDVRRLFLSDLMHFNHPRSSPTVDGLMDFLNHPYLSVPAIELRPVGSLEELEIVFAPRSDRGG